MTTTGQAEIPKVELLLASAHQASVVLRKRREVLVRSGIDKDYLGTETVLMAFALLGDHDRDELVSAVRPHWGLLQSKGLVYGPFEKAPTPELRLLAHILPHAKAIVSVWEQIRAVADAPAPPVDVWQSASSVRGLWGRKACVRFRACNVDHVFIEPDPVFGFQPAFLSLDPDVTSTGSFAFPIDNGAIAIRMRDRDGTIYRHVLSVSVEAI